jgi:beta-N-acetylhexosaminidase
VTLGPLMVDIAGTALTADDRDLLKHPLVGGVILFTRNFQDLAQLTDLVRQTRELRQPPLLIAVDHEGGRVQRFRQDFTVLPPMRFIGHRYRMDATAGRALARDCGWLMAAELRAMGIDISFAPVVDLEYGASAVIGDRAFDRHPRAVAELAIAFMHGMRDAGMAATAKHFPGHGAVVADSHVAMPVDRRSYADLDGDLYPYRRMIENAVPAIMMAHVIFEQVDPVPASFSRRWIQGELRTQLRFTGAVFSDDLSMRGASVVGDMPARVRAALEAGCDMVPICNDRAAVELAIQKLAPEPHWLNPTSAIRMARLRGGPTVDRQTLLAGERWLQCRRAADACLQRPTLSLDGG